MQKVDVWSCGTECEFANPLLDVNAIVGLQLQDNGLGDVDGRWSTRTRQEWQKETND